MLDTERNHRTESLVEPHLEASGATDQKVYVIDTSVLLSDPQASGVAPVAAAETATTDYVALVT